MRSTAWAHVDSQALLMFNVHRMLPTFALVECILYALNISSGCITQDMTG
jgi:hypothetical protein